MEYTHLICLYKTAEASCKDNFCILNKDCAVCPSSLILEAHQEVISIWPIYWLKWAKTVSVCESVLYAVFCISSWVSMIFFHSLRINICFSSPGCEISKLIIIIRSDIRRMSLFQIILTYRQLSITSCGLHQIISYFHVQPPPVVTWQVPHLLHDGTISMTTWPTWSPWSPSGGGHKIWVEPEFIIFITI